MENCCIWLAIYFNCTMMHGLTNLKSTMFFFIKASIPIKCKPLSRPKLDTDGNGVKETRTLFSKLQKETLMVNVYNY